jgi:microcystin-dependent protein
VPFSIARATGIGMFSATPKVNAFNIFHEGNLPSGTFTEPIGSIKMYAGLAAPAGGFYMLCDGSQISRTTYATLFSVIGTVYGGGDGANTFTIPDLRERVVIGKSATRTRIPQYDATQLGNSFGVGVHPLVVGEMPAHTHSVADSGHAHAITGQVSPLNGGSSTCIGGLSTGTGTTTTTAKAAITEQSVGGGAGHDNVQPSIVMNYIIRVM